MLKELKKELNALKSPKRAKASLWFFKTGPGQYGEGDIFIGLTVPQMRTLAKKHSALTVDEIRVLLISPIHEERLIALLLLVDDFVEGDKKQQKKIFDFYIKNKKFVNNWDLIDLSAHKIVGPYLFDKDGALLEKLAHSHNIWDRRIAVLATFYDIKQSRYTRPLKIAEMLVSDDHDLLQKAVGWMLREIGKRSLSDEEMFLRRFAATMPRTMLRYAIERFPEEKRKKYLGMKVSR